MDKSLSELKQDLLDKIAHISNEFQTLIVMHDAEFLLSPDIHTVADSLKNLYIKFSQVSICTPNYFD